METINYTHELISDACLAAEEGDLERIEELQWILDDWCIDENEKNALTEMLDRMTELAEFVMDAEGEE